MNYGIVADAFPPLKTSAAMQIRDLALEFVKQGHSITVLTPDPCVKKHSIENWRGIKVVRLECIKFKDVGLIRRTIAEFLMPIFMIKNCRNTFIYSEKWDGVISYSPSIFLGPVVKILKHGSKCKNYLILRDIFPEWAVDMGIISKGLPYWIFKAVQKYQYIVSDIIGIQSPGNKIFIDKYVLNSKKKVEVLFNWLEKTDKKGCSISLKKSPLSGRVLFVYAGNMGVAQGVDIFLNLSKMLIDRTDIGFVFVGRGTGAKYISDYVKSENPQNVLFFQEIPPEEIPGLFEQCQIGIVSLDSRHKTHNIPGKFVAYMRYGLPVLAHINQGNDLVEMINSEKVGYACTVNSIELLKSKALSLVAEFNKNEDMKSRCEAMSEKYFSTKVAVQKITNALS